MDTLTLERATVLGLDVFFFGTEEARTEFLAGVERVTGRETFTFETTVLRFPLLCGAVGRRTRPHVVTTLAPAAE